LFAPGLSVEDIKQQIIATIDYISDHDYWLKNHRPQYEVQFLPKVPLNVSNDEEAVRTMMHSYEQIMGVAPTLGFMPAVGDANYMFEKGVNCVNWGPGVGGGAHGTNECIEINEIINAAKVYASVAINWCGMA
jgi:acetylornithine deacetylase/succinyl-diaminopimelate desuccinylase-like protein